VTVEHGRSITTCSMPPVSSMPQPKFMSHTQSHAHMNMNLLLLTPDFRIPLRAFEAGVGSEAKPLQACMHSPAPLHGTALPVAEAARQCLNPEP
jgi:hypothetical protein